MFKNLSCGLVNVRSVKNKDIWLKQLLSEDQIDICILTETWLNKNDMEWIESCELNKDGFRMSNSFRNDGRRGGGIAVVYRDTFSIKQINEKHLDTYHSVKWRLSKKNLQLHIIGIYRPPRSESNMTSIAQFTDEFLYELQEDIKDSAKSYGVR